MSSVLTGITTNGSPHLGNYVGAMRPAIELSKISKSFIFLADYHSLIKQQDPELTHQSTLSIAAAWIACGLDLKNTIFYRQSSIPQIMELNWILTSITPKGLMNRAHAYKAIQDITSGKDKDKNVQMGLFNYPILMSADILIFNAELIPVGSDQKQHIEMTRDIANKFNLTYGSFFNLPEPLIDETTSYLPGLDGNKMSKSYSNYIDLFSAEKKLQKQINQIKTDSLEPGEKKPKDSTLYKYFKCFTNDKNIKQIDAYFNEGMSWGDLKKELFKLINKEISPARKKYFDLINNPKKVEKVLKEGEAKALKIASKNLKEIRSLVGIKAL
jgi:tryptophanyl-tRNA synthetase